MLVSITKIELSSYARLFSFKIKKILFSVLGLRNYLKVLHIVFYIAFDTNILKLNPHYRHHYFCKYLVNRGDVVVDLGANLGYFAKNFSRLVGDEGRVICIEPVKPFFEILQWAIGNKKNCTLYNYSLGNEVKTTTMRIPKDGGVFRTGLASIHTDQNGDNQHYYTFPTEMTKGSLLLNNLTKINFLKCDIEGYEEFVLPELKELLDKHKPIIQVETAGKAKVVISNLMREIAYECYHVDNHRLQKTLFSEMELGDYIFVHHTHEKDLLQRLKKIGRT